MEKILFCASDAGGMQNLVPIVLCAKEEHQCVVLASEVTSKFFEKEGIFSTVTKIGSLNEASEFLKEENPAAVISGTTCHVSSDRLLIGAAKAQGIRSLVVLDDWFSYRMRFADDDGNLVFIPDFICCQNQRSKEEAALEDLPMDNLVVTGSSSLTKKRKTYFDYCQKAPQRPGFLDDNSVVTFLSDRHALYYGRKTGEKGTLGDYIGYTEDEVRRDIFESLRKMRRQCTFVEKLHPNDAIRRKTFEDTNVKHVMIKDCDLLPLVWHSDAVLGMHSIALLEAVILEKKVASYQPHCKRQLCSAVRLGLIDSLENKEELDLWLKKSFTASTEGDAVRIELDFIDDNVEKTILELALGRVRA